MGIDPSVLDYLLGLAPQFPRGTERSVLELGESMTLGIDLAGHLTKIAAVTGHDISSLENALAACRRRPPPRVGFEEARAIYKWIFNCTDYFAIDNGSDDPKYRRDLNYPITLGRQFDIMINNGTSEHIFNQANVFQIMHDHTKTGGFMIHYTVGLGWLDHGFYNVQPHFFLDLSKYNRYELVSCAYVNTLTTFPLRPGEFSLEQIAANSRLADALLCACLRRQSDAAFCYPTQYLWAV